MMIKVKVRENICVTHFVCTWLRQSKVITIIIFYWWRLGSWIWKW